MLLRFEVENYKSFYDRAVFSMIPAPKQSGLNYSVLKSKIANKQIKAICSSVIYGPNASGKTNLIGAMDVLRAIILRGNIKNAEDQNSPNKAAYHLELIPNNIRNDRKPVDFLVEFVDGGIQYRYELSILLGNFLEIEFERNIRKEVLYINNKIVFIRTDKLEFGDFDELEAYNKQLVENYETIKIVAEQGLIADELFLTNGFRLLISQDLAKNICDWFETKFMVIYRADSMQLIKRFSNPQKNTLYVEETTNTAAKLFGINSNSVAYVANEDGKTKLYSVLKDKRNSKKAKLVLADIFESFGTIRFINLFPLVIQAIATGGVLVVDEFDASIHPMALMSIINIFHNDDININHAQLIFNTHNPIFLNSNIFRRDEIKFVDKDDNTLYSEMYSLADFGTAGPAGVRKNSDYMKNYFVSRYGAIKTIDFSPVFETFISEGGNNDK